MSLDQLSILFDRDKSVISRHIKKIFNEQELNKNSVVAKNATTANDGKTYIVKYYNLDMIISVRYRVNSKRGTKFRQWANQVLKEYLLKGYVINENRVVVSNENYIELKNEVSSINNRLLKIENEVFDKEYGLDKLFFDGQFYDAYTLIQSLFESANNEIIIIDNYIDRTILDRLTVKKDNVNVIIYINNNTSNLLTRDINTFNSQYGNLTVQYTTKVHDRYIVIDRIKLYHLGHSIKDYNKEFCVGKKIFSISESDSNLINDLLNNI